MKILDTILFEVVPPLKSSNSETREKILQRVKSVLDDLPNISHINVPEVVDENFKGEPYYKHVDASEFGQEIKKRLGVEVILNKVVVHLQSPETLVNWVEDTVSKSKISTFVWVGGNSSKFSYPGPLVLEANRATQNMKGVTFGNVLIPSRNHELEKMIEKTRTGCSFFTTQVLFNSEGLCPLLINYEEQCRKQGLIPARIYLSFAPAANLQDIEFLRWLGVHIPERVLRILHKGSIAKTSGRISTEVFNQICDGLQSSELTLGLNVEHINRNNFELAVDLGRALTKVAV